MQVHFHRTRLATLVVGVLMLATGRAGVAQAANPFVGAWELDRFKSVYEPITMAPERRILTLEASGDGIKSTTRTWRNAVAADVTYTAGFDGKDYPTAAAGATVAFKRINPTTVERTAKLNGTVAETQTWSVSADGKTLTIKAEGTDTAGNAFSSTQIYTRTSPTS
jgi:hypothetical protein